VLAAIGFNDQQTLGAGKIQDERPYRKLTAKFKRMQAAAS
jgi:hypothetical protein